MRLGVWILGVVAGMTAVITAPRRAAFGAGQNRLNVLFIMADDFREPGGPIQRKDLKTPNLDRLATRAVRFERAYAQYPVCNPSRTSLLLGRRCEETGIVENTTFFRSRHPQLATLPQLFRENGWYTASYGKIFHVGEVSGDVRIGWKDEAKSWDEALMFQPTPLGRKGEVRDLAPGKLSWCKVGAMEGEDDDQPDGQNAAAAAASIERQVQAGKSWFIAAGFHKPHDPFYAPKKYFDLYPTDKVKLHQDSGNLTPAPPLAIPKGWDQVFAGFTPEDRRDFQRAYLAGVSFMDAQVGRLLDTLDRLKLWENTVVVFLGDHGYHLGERNWWNKNTLFERSCRAPLLIAAPRCRRGQSSQSLVEFVDLYPTLADLAGLKPTHRLSGVSLAPVLKNPKQSVKSAAFTLVTRGPQRFGRSVRTSKWRYTLWSDGAEELYDAERDPEETRNRASESALESTRLEHRSRLSSLPPWPSPLAGSPNPAP